MMCIRRGFYFLRKISQLSSLMRRRQLAPTNVSCYSKLKTKIRTKVAYAKVKVVVEEEAEAAAAGGGNGGGGA